MKKIYILALCMLAVLCTNAQNTFSFQVNRFEYPVMLKTANNDVVYVACDTNYRGLWLVRLSPQNKLKFSRFISQPNLTNPQTVSQSIIETSDKGLLIGVYESEYTSRKANTVIIKCDSSGNILWQKRLNDGSKYFETATPLVCEAPDKSLYVAGGDLYNYHDFIKMSSKGNVLWHKRYYGHVEGQFYNYRGIAADADNVYFCASVPACWECNYLYSDIYKLSKTGDLVWEKGLDYHYVVKYMKALGNDKFDMVLYYDKNFNNPKYVTGTFNLTKATVYGKAVGYNIFSLIGYGKKNNIDFLKDAYVPNDLFFYGGSLINNDWSVYALSTLFLNKYDTLNRICPDYTLPVVDTLVVNRPFKVFDKTSDPYPDTTLYVTTATFTSVNKLMPFDVVCTGEAPAANAAIASSLKAGKPTVSISPNPVKDMFTIYSNSLSGKNITVINVTGKLVLKDAFLGGQHSVNVSMLPTGLYYVKVTDNNGNSETIKLVKQ